MFSLASTPLTKIASPAFNMAYKRAQSIWTAKNELKKLTKTIETIKAVLLDAEKKQDNSDAVKDWIRRVRDVLYDADDLFDEVATDEMLKQRINKEENFLKKVQASCCKFNPIISRNSIAKKVKTIRKRLHEISNDMAQFHFVIRQHEEPVTGSRQGQDPGSFVDSNEVFGRDKEKKAILKFLLQYQSNDTISVAAIVGIGGMGKTTFAQLVYNDKVVRENFQKFSFACISDTSDDTEIIGKIFQSVCEKNYGDFTLDHLQTKIRDSIKRKKFLLVLDDVWDDNHDGWRQRMSLLRGCAKGSKIIVTTRSFSVARAMEVLKPHILELDGLSKDESWALFRRVALTPAQEAGDSRWTDMGREIVKKCVNVPLAIKSIGNVLYRKQTIQEWEYFKNEELTKLGGSGQDPVFPVLKLSYDHLHSSVKCCFAYCSLFPKNYIFKKHDLIYHWIAQGYIKPSSDKQTVEEVGHSYFMDLFRMSFFQEAKYDKFGEIKECKMHDLIHDLAHIVAAGEAIMLTTSTTGTKGTPRLATIGCIEGDSPVNLAPLGNGNRLRSLFFIGAGSTRGLVLDQEFAKLKFLRALSMSGMGIKNVPSSIGELKLLRYLDISSNKFKSLPDSITKLLNLCALDLSDCCDLESLPNDFKKLVNLGHLKIMYCKLRYVPPEFGKLASLQHLDRFIVGGGTDKVQSSNLGELFGLKIRGKLDVRFGMDSNDADWDGVEGWQPLVNLQGLRIHKYNGTRIQHWANGRLADNRSPLLPNLTKLNLFKCHRVKCFPPFRHIPNLKRLIIRQMNELEYIEEEEEENEGKQNLAAVSNAFFLPYVMKLTLRNLPKLKGWSRKVEILRSSSLGASSCPQLPSFPSLSTIKIRDCKELKYMPQCPSLRVLTLTSVKGEVIPQLLSIHDHSSSSTSTSTPSTPSLERVDISSCDGLTSFPGQHLMSLSTLEIHDCKELKYMPQCPNLRVLTLTSVNGKVIPQLLLVRDHTSPSTTTSTPSTSSLKHVKISSCDELTSFPGQYLTSLRHLELSVSNIERAKLPPWHLNILEDLDVQGCRGLELWEEGKRGVDWDSLPNLRKLYVDFAPSKKLPDCLRNLQSRGKLKIKYSSSSRAVHEAREKEFSRLERSISSSIGRASPSTQFTPSPQAHDSLSTRDSINPGSSGPAITTHRPHTSRISGIHRSASSRTHTTQGIRSRLSRTP